MTLTEEQREAIRAVSDLPRAIGCTRCHNYIQKNYSNQFAVLRSMIDNKDYVPNAAELIELLAAGEHEQWADWAQSILDSEPGLSEGRKAAWPGMIATPYENLSEELKDKDRREVHLRSSVALDIVQQQATRIKELEDAHKRSGAKYAKIINELRSSVYANIPGLDVGKIGPDAKSVNKGNQCQYCKKCGRDMRFEFSIRDEIWNKLPKTWKDRVLCIECFLEELNEVEPDQEIHFDDFNYMCILDPIEDTEWKGDRPKLLHPLFGGTLIDAKNPLAWQITEERKAAIWHAVAVLKENDPDDEHLWDEEIAVLRAMLTEAEQCE